MSPKPERTHLTPVGDRRAFDEVSSFHFSCSCLSSLLNSPYLGLPELRSTIEAWTFLIFDSTTVRAKSTKSHHVISCLWGSACFFLTVWNVPFQVVLIIDTGILWNLPWLLFPWSWEKLIVPHSGIRTLPRMHTCFSIYYSVSPTGIYSPKTELLFDYLLCPLPNRGHQA